MTDTAAFGSPAPATLWRSSERPLSEFRRTLPANDLDDLLEAARRCAAAERPATDLTATDLPVGPLAGFLDELRSELIDGSGFVLLDGVPVHDQPLAVTECVFWGIGLQLGTAVSQSVMGERLGHVRDMTKGDPHARAYRNRSELTPHSDPADILSFLCINPSASGGVSRFVSSATIHETIRSERPDLLERLYRGYRYHRLGEFRPGSGPVTDHRVPVFSVHESLVSCRYVRQYIEVAADEFDDISLDALDREAFELLESLAADPSLHHQFTMQSGEAVFANNFTVLHARSSFQDAEGQPPRHLLRLWLSTDPKRPVTPNILHYDGEPGIPAVAGRMPSYETSVEVQ